MTIFERLNGYRPQALALLRIMAALLFIEHGTMKLFGFPVGGGGSLPPALMVAAFIEVIGGILLAVGLFTRPVAFIMCGEMAVAYFMAHAPKGFFPTVNAGESAILFCFVFLYFVFAGAGAWSVDNRRA
jgi:putative oxidoreductase